MLKILVIFYCKWFIFPSVSIWSEFPRVYNMQCFMHLIVESILHYTQCSICSFSYISSNSLKKFWSTEGARINGLYLTVRSSFCAAEWCALVNSAESLRVSLALSWLSTCLWLVSDAFLNYWMFHMKRFNLSPLSGFI